jgi:hypothetical protein
MCLIKLQVTKKYGRVEVHVQALLTAVLDGGEWSASRRGQFNPTEKPDAH